MLESKRRAAIFLLLAFILALSAGYLVLQKVKDLNAELGGMTKIYVAKGDIPVRALIEENHITTTEIPNKFVNKAHITDKDKIINNVSVVPLSEGEIITENMLKPFTELRNENSRLIAMYPSEKIQFDQVVETLDRVDIIVSTNNNGEQKTEVFMRDVPVAWAQGNEENFAGAALEVSMEDAPKLIHMQNYADKVRILKANVGKDESVELTNEQAEKPEAAQTGAQEKAAGSQDKPVEQKADKQKTETTNKK